MVPICYVFQNLEGENENHWQFAAIFSEVVCCERGQSGVELATCKANDFTFLLSPQLCSPSLTVLLFLFWGYPGVLTPDGVRRTMWNAGDQLRLVMCKASIPFAILSLHSPLFDITLKHKASHIFFPILFIMSPWLTKLFIILWFKAFNGPIPIPSSVSVTFFLFWRIYIGPGK